MSENCLKQKAIEAKRRIRYGYQEANRGNVISYSKLKLIHRYIDDDYVIARLLEIVQTGDDTVNPLPLVIDRNYISGLSLAERQRYVFRISAAYVYIKKIYAELPRIE
jgi:hypothetical protein